MFGEDQKESLHKLLLWEPKHGKLSRGRLHKTIMKQVDRGTNLRKEEFMTARTVKRG